MYYVGLSLALEFSPYPNQNITLNPIPKNFISESKVFSSVIILFEKNWGKFLKWVGGSGKNPNFNFII